SSTTRDPQFVGGFAPWALRRNLEALRKHERIMEAESKTSRTEVALLGSEGKIGKMEREILHHNLSRVEETLGKVFATSMNEFMANINNGAGGSEGASGSGGAGRSGGTGGNADGTGVRGRSGGTGGNADGTGVRGAGPTIPELTGMEQELYNLRMEGMDIDGYTNRFHELALLCPRMVEPEA
nr:putative reverse transcriptase domain-containing protein [Tanacetum cinerariifolium]